MGKDKNLEDTQDLDVKTIRSVSSKSVQRKKTKNEISKGGSSRSRSASSAKRKQLLHLKKA
ncbi:MAG: hypothetical protein IJS17_04085 [Clostridia bacterium]|nr:hypothetical protein [Clostridia bacterium]